MNPHEKTIHRKGWRRKNAFKNLEATIKKLLLKNGIVILNPLNDKHEERMFTNSDEVDTVAKLVKRD